MKKICGLIFLIVLSIFVCFAQNEADVKNTDTKSNEVKINLIVSDKDNGFINDLRNEDITVFVDGKEQTDFTIEKETLPLLYMISVDNSGSMRTILDDIKNSIRLIIKQNNPDDLTALMRFVSFDIIQTTDKFSSDEKYLFSNVDLFQTEGGRTAVIDAIYNAVQIVSIQKGVKDNYRRIVVVFSDGEDRASKNTQEQLSKLLKENNVQVFFIGLVNELEKDGGFVGSSPKKKAIKFIENVAEESGGVAIFPDKIEDLPIIAHQIVEQMRTQFVIKLPTVENLDNTQIEIKPTKIAKKKLKFNYRVGSVK